jgi:hypothetical protein
VSRFCDDSLDFARSMLEEAGVVATPGVDFDPVHGRHFIRFCYAGAEEEVCEAVERVTAWLRRAVLLPLQHRSTQPAHRSRLASYSKIWMCA